MMSCWGSPVQELITWPKLRNCRGFVANNARSRALRGHSGSVQFMGALSRTPHADQRNISFDSASAQTWDEQKWAEMNLAAAAGKGRQWHQWLAAKGVRWSGQERKGTHFGVMRNDHPRRRLQFVRYWKWSPWILCWTAIAELQIGKNRAVRLRWSFSKFFCGLSLSKSSAMFFLPRIQWEASTVHYDKYCTAFWSDRCSVQLESSNGLNFCTVPGDKSKAG